MSVSTEPKQVVLRAILAGWFVVSVSAQERAQTVDTEELYRSATTHIIAGEYEEATDALEKLETAYRDRNDLSSAAVAQYQRALVYKKTAEDAAENAESRPELAAVSLTFRKAANALAGVKSPDRAFEISAHLAAAELHRKYLDDTTAGDLFSEGASYYRESDRERAIELAEKAGEAYDAALEDAAGETEAGLRAKAIAVYGQALDLRHLSNPTPDVAYAKSAEILGRLHYDAGNKEQAVRWMNAARDAYALNNESLDHGDVLFSLLRTYEKYGTPQERKEQTRKILVELDQLIARAKGRDKAIIYFGRGKSPEANAPGSVTWFEKSKQAIDQTGDVDDQLAIRLAMVDYLDEEKNELEALDTLMEVLGIDAFHDRLKEEKATGFMNRVRNYYTAHKDPVRGFYDSRGQQEHAAGNHAAEAARLARAGLMVALSGDEQLANAYYGRAAAEESPARGALLLEIASYQHSLSREEEALKYVQSAVDAFGKAGATAEQANALTRLATLQHAENRDREAAATLERAAALYGQLNDSAAQLQVISDAMKRLATVMNRTSAVSLFQRARKAQQEAKNAEGEALLLETMAGIFDGWNEKEEANKYRAEARTLTGEAEN